MKIYLTCVILFVFVFSARCSPITLWNNNASNFSIVLENNSSPELKKAAELFQKYINQKSGVQFPLMAEKNFNGKNGIYIGSTALSKSIFNRSKLTDRGYFVGSHNGNIILVGSSEKGSINAIFGFLDKFLDVQILSTQSVYLIKEPSKTLNFTNQYVNPSYQRMDIFNAISYNDNYSISSGFDHLFKNNYNSEWGMFGHTFFNLIPPNKYLKSNPEFFIYEKSKPSQLNIYNQKLIREVVNNLRLRIAKQPEKKYWMVGQEDDKSFKSSSNSKSLTDDLIKFINSIAKEFPDKVIGTFAYQETLNAPINTKPLSNVLICFAPIDAVYNKNIYSGQNVKYSNELVKWSKITNDMMVWEYVSNYSNPMLPYPTFNVISDNLKFYYNNGVKRIYLEGLNRNEEVFNELYTYLFTKLYWDINRNPKEVVEEFSNKFYGPAGKDVLKYILAVENNVKSTGDNFRFYDTGKKYLSNNNLRNYDSILEKASNQVANNPVYLKRVNKVRSQVDINLMNGKMDSQDRRTKRFKQTMKDTEVSSVMFNGKNIKVQ